MPAPVKRTRYHHGDLRSALVDTAIELIGERGVGAFSLAEASRRLGVSVSAPYSHFADRDQLLAAVAVRAYGALSNDLLAEIHRFQSPADRLAAAVRAYVRFAAAHRALFQVMFEAGVDKARHPEVEQAALPLADSFLEAVRALSDGEERLAEAMARAVGATAHGYAALLLDGSFGHGDDVVEIAAGRAATATMALVEGRRAFRSGDRAH